MDCDAITFCHGDPNITFFSEIAKTSSSKLIQHFKNIEDQFKEEFSFQLQKKIQEQTPLADHFKLNEVMPEKVSPIRYCLPGTDNEIIRVAPHYFICEEFMHPKFKDSI